MAVAALLLVICSPGLASVINEGRSRRLGVTRVGFKAWHGCQSCMCNKMATQSGEEIWSEPMQEVGLGGKKMVDSLTGFVAGFARCGRLANPRKQP